MQNYSWNTHLELYVCVEIEPFVYTLSCIITKTQYTHIHMAIPDIDECSIEPNKLCATEPHTVCNNSVGSYTCVCEEGYKSDTSGVCRESEC